MGSYITIINNTPNQYQCDLTADKKALNIASFGSSIITIISSILTVIGLSSWISTFFVGDNPVSLFRVSANTLYRLSTISGWTAVAVSGVGALSAFSVSIVKFVYSKLLREHYILILPWQKHQFRKRGVGFWCESVCVNTEIYNETTVRVIVVHLRPLHGARVSSSSREYRIQDFIDKGALRTHYFVGTAEETALYLRDPGKLGERYKILQESGMLNDTKNMLGRSMSKQSLSLPVSAVTVPGKPTVIVPGNSAVSVPEKSSVSLPIIPKVSVVGLPKVSVPVLPKASVPVIPKETVPVIPNEKVPAIPKVAVPVQSSVSVPVIPTVNQVPPNVQSYTN